MNVQLIKEQWDRALAVVAALAGVVAVVLGWVGVSGAALTTQQLPYIASGGVVGIILFGVACTLWISADLRDEWAKLEEINGALQRDAAPAADALAGAEVLQAASTELAAAVTQPVRVPARRRRPAASVND